MLKLVLATVALVFSWRWLRAEFSRMLEPNEPIRPSALALRGAVLIAAAVWFVLGIAATFGRVFGWMLGLAVIGAFVWYFFEGRRLGKAELDRRGGAEPERDVDKQQN
ncbi:MAG: hypothetical protein IAG13_18810 [Deltaproteobacteria bacterium]|nr:hypothetical protein [Nannocystaceae bacterium]